MSIEALRSRGVGRSASEESFDPSVVVGLQNVTSEEKSWIEAAYSSEEADFEFDSQDDTSSKSSHSGRSKEGEEEEEEEASGGPQRGVARTVSQDSFDPISVMGFSHISDEERDWFEAAFGSSQDDLEAALENAKDFGWEDEGEDDETEHNYDLVGIPAAISFSPEAFLTQHNGEYAEDDDISESDDDEVTTDDEIEKELRKKKKQEKKERRHRKEERLRRKKKKAAAARKVKRSEKELHPTTAQAEVQDEEVHEKGGDTKEDDPSRPKPPKRDSSEKDLFAPEFFPSMGSPFQQQKRLTSSLRSSEISIEVNDILLQQSSVDVSWIDDAQNTKDSCDLVTAEAGVIKRRPGRKRGGGKTPSAEQHTAIPEDSILLDSPLQTQPNRRPSGSLRSSEMSFQVSDLLMLQQGSQDVSWIDEAQNTKDSCDLVTGEAGAKRRHGRRRGGPTTVELKDTIPESSPLPPRQQKIRSSTIPLRSSEMSIQVNDILLQQNSHSTNNQDASTSWIDDAQNTKDSCDLLKAEGRSAATSTKQGKEAKKSERRPGRKRGVTATKKTSDDTSPSTAMSESLDSLDSSVVHDHLQPNTMASSE